MKKGYTLIELVICMAVILIFASVCFVNIGAYEKMSILINSHYCESSIISFICNSKKYCRNNNTPGTIIFDDSNDLMVFSVGKYVKNVYRFPKNFILENVKTDKGYNIVTIDKTGFTSDACTIRYHDDHNYFKPKSITILVGTDYVSEK